MFIRICPLAVMFFVLLRGIGAFAHEPKNLTLFTEEYPPFNYSDQGSQVMGISSEIVEALMKKSGLNYTVTVYPWARALAVAKNTANTCVFSVSRTPEREKDYRWIGPLVVNEWALFNIKGSSKPPRTLESVRGDIIGSYVGDAVVKYLEDKKFKLDLTKTDEQNPMKLRSKRIDYWATGKLTGEYILKKQNIKNIVPVLIFNKTEMYLACSKETLKSTMDELQVQLKDMIKDGSIKKIYKKYGYEG